MFNSFFIIKGYPRRENDLYYVDTNDIDIITKLTEISLDYCYKYTYLNEEDFAIFQNGELEKILSKENNGYEDYLESASKNLNKELAKVIASKSAALACGDTTIEDLKLNLNEKFNIKSLEDFAKDFSSKLSRRVTSKSVLFLEDLQDKAILKLLPSNVSYNKTITHIYTIDLVS